MSNIIDTRSSQKLKDSFHSNLLGAPTRQKIALQAIGGHRSISYIAGRYDVSRKFVYKQRECALRAIAGAFAGQSSCQEDENVLYYIPVTKQWLTQV